LPSHMILFEELVRD